MRRHGLTLALLALLGCDPPSGATGTTSPAPGAGSATRGATHASHRARPAAPAASASPCSASDKLDFDVDGRKVRSLSTRELCAAVGVETFTVFDPYYQKPKTFRALPLGPLLRRGFAGEKVELAGSHFVLRATDGYTVPIEGKRLFEAGGYLAVADVDVPGWQPIGPQQANPGPYYLVWRDKEQQDTATHPRPWQLATISITPFEKTFPKTVPTGEEPSSKPWRGFAIFREQCIRCHSVNQQGGRVGPDLNVPRSIVEYRPEAQIRAYIKQPRAFRYGNMPDNPHLTEADLDALVAYFRAMSRQKHDPGQRGAHP